MAADSSTTAAPNGPGAFLAPLSSAPAEDAALDAILQSLVVGVTALPGPLVRPRWQAIPPPIPEITVDWAAIGVTEETTEPNVDTLHQATGGPIDGLSTTLEWTELTVSCSFYGPNARGNAKLLRAGLMVAQNRETLYRQDLALKAIPGPTTFLGEIVNQQTYRRVDISFVLRRTVTRTWPVDNILSMHGTIYTDDGATEPVAAS